MAILEGNTTTWRISDGILKTGRGRDGDRQLKDITGFLKSVSYFEGVKDDGEPYAQVEANLENAEGETVRVKAAVGLNANNSNVAAFGFITGLLGCQEGDDIGIFPSQATKPHEKYGVKPTFVSVGICKGGSIYRPVRVNRDDYPGATSREKFPHALDAFKKHPAYIQREAYNPDAEPDISIFATISYEMILPDPFGPAESVYLAMLSKFEGSPVKAYEDITEETATKFAEWYERAKTKDLPKALQPYARPKTTDAEYDPFADE
jgi:hypothetical protein